MNDKLAELEKLVKFQMDTIEQSFVSDPEDADNLNVTTNLDEWLEMTKQNDVFSKNTEGTGPNPDRVPELYKQHLYHLNFDYEIIKNASGYLLSPVYKYKGKAEYAACFIFSSLKEMKDYLKDKKYLLYHILISIKSNEIDRESFKVKPLGNSIIVYIFRGHILE